MALKGLSGSCVVKSVEWSKTLHVAAGTTPSSTRTGMSLFQRTQRDIRYAFVDHPNPVSGNTLALTIASVVKINQEREMIVLGVTLGTG